MLRFMLDTDTSIYVIKNNPAEIREKFNEYCEQLCISSITFMELFYGAENSQAQAKNHDRLMNYAARLEVLDFSQKAAKHAGSIKSELKQKGIPIGSYDLQIAGHARAYGLTLITNNTKEFDRVDGLMLGNWTAPTP